MHALSDAIRLREALMAERRHERAKTAVAPAGTIVFPVALTKAATPAPTAGSGRSGWLERLRSIACL